MRLHKGMRPQDIVVLLKLSHAQDKRQRSLAEALYMSQAEISDSLGRSHLAGLLDGTKKIVYRNNLLEFLLYGLKYTFPAIPGRVQRGVPTAISAAPLQEEILSEVKYVWPYAKGEIMGESIDPLHQNQHLAALADSKLHQKLALVDAIRLRKPRETQLAIQHLQNLLRDE